MSLLNLLSAVTGMVQPQQDQPPSVSELAVTGAKPQPRFNPQMQAPPGDPGPLQGAPQMQMDPQAPPDPGTPQTAQPPRMNYDNSGSVGAVGAALQGEGTPRGGSANPGVYGLLPQHLQHGTLRNILGALGDAFLVGHGDAAQYRPRMEQQEIGNAMAGMDMNDPASVQAAVQRVAATGAPGSVEMADKIQQQAEQAALRRQYMQYNQDYRQSQTDAKHESLYNRMYVTATGDLGRATSAADYAARLARWDARIKAIDPNMDAATALGVPQDYDATAVNGNMGMTSNQTTQSSDRAAQRVQSGRDTDVRADATIRAAGIGGSTRIQAAGISANRPSDAQQRQALQDKQNRGETLTPAESESWTRLTHVTDGHRTLPPGLVAGGGARPAAAPARAPATRAGFVEGKTYVDANGHRAKYSQGRWIPQ